MLVYSYLTVLYCQKDLEMGYIYAVVIVMVVIVAAFGIGELIFRIIKWVIE